MFCALLWREARRCGLAAEKVATVSPGLQCLVLLKTGDVGDQLNTKLGRPPKADELIAAAGGCQRKRALATLKALKLDLSERAVRSVMLFPAAVEQALRAQMDTWMDLAANHLAARNLEESDRVEAQVATQSALIEELQGKVRLLQKQIADRERMVAELDHGSKAFNSWPLIDIEMRRPASPDRNLWKTSSRCFWAVAIIELRPSSSDAPS